MPINRHLQRSIMFDKSHAIESIGEGAFNMCKDLKMVRLPDGVKEIAYIAFAYCDSLKTINLPESIEDIERSAFFSCDNLEGEINIPKGMVTIRENTFGWCKKLKNVNLPMGLKTIEKSAFCGAGLEEIILPEGLETIGESSFSCSELNSIIIPETVTLIEGEAFSNCLHMEKVLIPDGVTKIGSMAFKNCGAFYGKTFVIYCNENSEAERYAKENEIPYKPISQWGEPEIINTFNGCKGSPVKLSMTCKESDEFTFECADNCGMQSKFTGYSSIQAGGYVSYSKNYELIFGKSGIHIISAYQNGNLLESDEIIIADGHIWGSGKIDKKATCTENGKIKYTCSHCKNTKTEYIPATGHDYTKWRVTSKPDCVSDGTRSRRCKKCSVNSIERIPSTPNKHNWSRWQSVKNYAERDCKICGKKQNMKISHSKKTLNKKKSFNLKVKKCIKGDRVLKYTSSNKKVATVNKKGKVTAKKEGKAKITVKMKSGCKATCIVTVK